MKELTNLLLAVIVIGILFNIFYKHRYLTKVKSNLDGRMYVVRRLPDKQAAADRLATLSDNLTNIVNHVYTNDKDKDGVEQLKQNFNSRNITENLPGGKYTAYQ